MSESVHSTPVLTKRTDENDIVKIMQTPVSYTHLDVYKRQPVDSGMGWGVTVSVTSIGGQSGENAWHNFLYNYIIVP